MEIITDLKELSRDELIKKCNERFQNRIAELQVSVEVNEKKVAELTDKYMNEVNMRKTAEASAEDATSKVEELQNALDSFQRRAYELEKEMETHKLALQERNLQSSQSPLSEEMLEEGDETQHDREGAMQFSQSSLSEEIFEALVDTEHEETTRRDELREEFLEQMNQVVQEQARALSRCSKSGIFNDLDNAIQRTIYQPIERSLADLSEKLAQERQHSIMLEDKLAGLEESFHELNELKDTVIQEADNQEEWLKAMLAKEREQNELLSQESDRAIEELQEKLKDAHDLNSQLLRWKDEVFNSANFQEETEAKYKEIIAQYEIELEEAKNGLSDIRAELLALRCEQKRTLEEELEDEIFTSTPKKHKPPDSEVSLGNELREEQEEEEGGKEEEEEEQEEEEVSEKEETPVMTEYGNQKYRIMLAQLIWHGMQNLLNL